ncbi:Rne/Rng family ribonuclease [Brevibacterium luteolum]|uniref:Rne/Rng family ribonuclease n=1 Tax=Brevibacterium luteolum TaxID=199591 RepID=UPI0021AF121A|nr:Rne/Rng family ribonuclease [Brevibacterium luteolum]MCT1830086.1 Rne/Rng family ribonuclease [Brevibacterium luteolum]
MNHEPEDQQNPTEGILADLENLRAQSEAKRTEDDASSRDDALAVLDEIAEKAESLRAGQSDAADDDDSADESDAAEEQTAPAATRRKGSGLPKSARSAVANRGLIFESYVGDSTEDDDDDSDDDDDDTPAQQAVTLDVRNPFSFGFNAAREETDDEPLQPVSVPAGGGLLFQTPQAELGQQVDPDWTPDDDDDDDDDDTDDSDRDDRSDRDDDSDDDQPRRRRRGGRGKRSRGRGGQNDGDSGSDNDNRGSRRQRGDDSDSSQDDNSKSDDSTDSGSRGSQNDRDDQKQDRSDDSGDSDDDSSSSRRRRRRRSRSGSGSGSGTSASEVTGVKGSTRLEAKRQRRREGREAGRRRPVISEAEFLARRESVERTMLVRDRDDRTQLVVTEDGIAVEHYLSESKAQASLIGNVYLGKVQNVLPSMEAAFVDIGKGRNAVLYAGEVNWDALGMDGKPRRIELALSPGDSVLVQVTKDPIGHKGARLTAQISLPGRFLVYVPGNDMTGISRKLPDNERQRLKKLLKQMVPESAGVIVRTAAEGASETELGRDIERLSKRWASIEKKSKSTKTTAPQLLYKEPDMIVRIIRDVFNEDFSALVVDGDESWETIHEYVEAVAPDLLARLSRYEEDGDIFDHYRVSEQIDKALQRKVMLPSGGSLVIDRTEAMTVIDVNTGKFTGSGGNLEETVTKNNLEAAEEVIRQLRLRDIGGIIVVDFIDMVLESNRDLVVRRLVECLGRDRTRHQVAEVTSLGLVQMTRKRIGTGLAESLAAAGEDLSGRGLVLPGTEEDGSARNQYKSRKRRGQDIRRSNKDAQSREDEEKQSASRSAVAAIAKATLKSDDDAEAANDAKANAENQAKAEDQAKADPQAGDAGEQAKADEQKSDADGQLQRGSGSSRSRRSRRAKKQDATQAEAKQAEADQSDAAQESAGASDSAAADASTGSQDASTADTAEAGEQKQKRSRSRRSRKPAEPSGPAPLMIGADAETRVQEAPVQRAPVTQEPAQEEAQSTRTEPAQQAEEKKAEEKKAAAPPILIIGADD